MQATPSLDAFWRSSGPRYTVGRSWIYFSASPRLYGFMMFGQSDDLDLRDICGTIERELEQSTPHVAYLDASRLEGIDPAALVRLGELFVRRRVALKKHIERIAMVEPPGFTGALFAGLDVVLPRPVRRRRFSTASDALAWLHWPEPSLASQLDQVFFSVTGADSLETRLRSLLEDRPGRVSLAEAARALKVSPRSLQRYLQETGRSFRGEVAEAQVRVAQRLLTATDAKLTSIAVEVGSSSQHFSALFRKVTGEAPSRWRARSGNSGE